MCVCVCGCVCVCVCVEPVHVAVNVSTYDLKYQSHNISHACKYVFEKKVK